VTGIADGRHRSSAERPNGTTQHKDSEPSHTPGSRTPHYVVVICASDWVKERFPAAGTNLCDALQTGKDRHRDPEPDLEAEP
jgi:hypothetical protein